MTSNDDRTMATLRAALESTGSRSYRMSTGPCCEAMTRVESSPGDATTLVGWLCQRHGLTVRAEPTGAPATFSWPPLVGTGQFVLPPSAGTSPARPDEHPAPWRWVDADYATAFDTTPDEKLVRLVDANAVPLLAPAAGISTRWIECPSPLARELIRLAPEMEALLRKRGDDGCHFGVKCADAVGVDELTPMRPCPSCDRLRVLAALDAARSVKP